MKTLLFLAITLLSGCYAQAATFPPDSKIEIVDDFSGGLNTSVVPHKLNKSFSPALSNVLIDETPGQIRKRKGFNIVGSSVNMNGISFMAKYVKADNTEVLIVSDGQSVAETEDFVNFISIKTGLSNQADLDSVQVEDEMWFTNGVNAVFKWDGTTTTDLDGTGSTPDVPKGKYIEYWQNRVWLFNLDTDASSLRFSSLTGADGTVISPSSNTAWGASNQLFVNKGNGQDGTGMKDDWGTLIIYKENSIYRVVGDNEFNYYIQKVEDDAGAVSDKTIIYLDGYQYFLGLNGIYKFNGVEAKRISDAIKDDVATFYKTIAKTNNITFNYVNFSTAPPNVKNIEIDEFGRLYTQTATIRSPNLEITGCDEGQSAVGLPPCYDGPRFAPLANVDSTYEGVVYGLNSPNSNMQLTNLKGYLSQYTYSYVTGWCDTVYKINIFSGDGSVYSSTYTSNTISASIAPPLIYVATLTFTTNQIPWDPNDTTISSVTVRYSVVSTANCISPYPADSRNAIILSRLDELQIDETLAFQRDIFIPDSYIFTSHIGTATQINSWASFNSERDINGGTIEYVYRTTDTHISNLSSIPYKSVVPGASIVETVAASTNAYIQWIATFTPNGTTPNYLTNVIANYNLSGSNIDKAYATQWDNRYWLSVTTDASLGSRIIYVKAKDTNPIPDAFVKFEGLNVTSFAEFNDFLYAGGKSTDSIKQLDVGDQDNNQAITSYYETPELTLGNNYFKKNILSVMVDIDEQTSSTLDIQTSDDGADFVSSTRALTTDTRQIISVNNVGGRPARYYKVRIENSDISKDMKLNGIAVIYKPTFIQADKP